MQAAIGYLGVSTREQGRSGLALLGLSRYSSEKEVIEKLGPPGTVSINEAGSEKVMSYPNWYAAFGLKKVRLEMCAPLRLEASGSTMSSKVAHTAEEPT